MIHLDNTIMAQYTRYGMHSSESMQAPVVLEARVKTLQFGSANSIDGYFEMWVFAEDPALREDNKVAMTAFGGLYGAQQKIVAMLVVGRACSVSPCAGRDTVSRSLSGKDFS